MNKWLRLACERVFRLLPCTPGAKKPAIVDWPHEATSDSAKIRRWALEFPHCNWGAAMGAGLLAVDIDAKNGHSGFETLRALEQEHERLPTTLTNLTPHKGEHRIFRVAGQIRNSVGKLGQGLDIRGDGGFILIPPSQIDGTSYRWKDSSAAIARAPEWLLTLIAKPAVDRSSLVPEGKRNGTVFRKACHLRSLNIAHADARSKLHEFNRVFCVPPLRGSEVDQCLTSAWRYPPGYPPNDLGNAQRFVNTYGRDVRYVVEPRHFIHWDEHQWRIDYDDLVVLGLMKLSNLKLFEEAKSAEDDTRRSRLARYAINAQNTPRVKQAVESVKSEVGIAVRIGMLNVNPLLLGVHNGVIDLTRGKCRAGLT